jgi:hypothetical protein
MQVGVVADLCQQRFEALAGCCQRRQVLAHHLRVSQRDRPQQLGLGVGSSEPAVGSSWSIQLPASTSG